jgi:3-hydroxyacyl-[acyl-carrier protein] dehydratase/trans-2-decenoyl-[acyl-carrier protein] isomerase
MENPCFSRSELIRCTQGTLFGSDTPKLPGPPLLAFDQVIEISTRGGKFGRGYAIGKKDLSTMDWVFDSHFLDDPVMPGTMLVEGLLQLAGFFGGYVGGRGQGRVARIDDVKFLTEVTPEDQEVLYRIDVRKSSPDHALLVAEGRVTARETERTTVGSLFVIVKRPKVTGRKASATEFAGVEFA